MTHEKMTVHKALCELKTLDARITKAIQSQQAQQRQGVRQDRLRLQ